MAGLNNLFPHLLPDDIEIWQQFLDKFGKDYIKFDYDVRVGDGRPTNETLPDNIRKMAKDLSQRRIDAVGHKADALDIIEITKSAGFTAIGQLETYPLLYRQRFSPDKRLVPVLVAGRIQSDIKPILIKKGIRTHVFPI